MKFANGLVQSGKIVLGSGMGSVFLLATNIVLARVLRPTTYGDYTTAFTLINGGMFFAVFGMTQFLLQEFGRRGQFAPGFARAARLSLLGSTVVSCVGVALCALVAGISKQAGSLAILLLPLLVAQAAGDVASVYFQITRQAWLSGGWVGLLNLLRLVGTIAFVLIAKNVYLIPVYQGVGAVLFAAASIYLIERMFSEYSAADIGQAPETLHRAVGSTLIGSCPYAIASLMYFGISQLPLLLFATIAGSRATAIYGVAYLIVSTFYFIPQTLMIRYLQLHYHSIATNDRVLLRRLYKDGTKWAAAAGAVLAVAIFLFIPFLIRLVFGTKYDESIHLTQIMLICLPLRFMTVNLAAVAVAGVSIWHKNFADIATGVFAVVIFSVLISRYGEVGGAYAAVLAEMMLLASHFYIVEKYLDRFAAKNPAARI